MHLNALRRYLIRRLTLLALTALAAAGTVAAPVVLTEQASEKGIVKVTQLLSGLEHPWALAFLPNNDGLLITERPGRLRYVDNQGKVSAPIAGTPEVFARGQGGLLDIALAPDFAESRLVYLAFAEAGPNRLAGTAVGRGRLSTDYRRLDDFEVIFRQEPKRSTGVHFGVRMVFDDAGHLYIALGENNQRLYAQDLDKLQGKVVRLFANGQVPSDNPFAADKTARSEVWSYGHRNPQGLAWHPETQALWLHEHGPRGGDEINLVLPGKNYGWPRATHGINYSGLPIPEAEANSLEGMEDPIYVWTKSPAISGMAFYTSDRTPAWQGDLFIGALKDRALIRLELENDRVVHEERLLQDLGRRIRDVRVGADGALYVLTDESDGALLKVELEP